MDTVNGLPLHPLLVHFVVVVVPVTALLALIAALWPAARTKMGVVPSVLALLALIATPITATAGESLEQTLQPFEALERHTEAGDLVIVGVGCLFGAVALMYLLTLPAVTERLPVSVSVVTVLDVLARVLTVAAAVVAIYLVFRAGDTGSRAVWGTTG